MHDSESRPENPFRVSGVDEELHHLLVLEQRHDLALQILGFVLKREFIADDLERVPELLLLVHLRIVQKNNPMIHEAHKVKTELLLECAYVVVVLEVLPVLCLELVDKTYQLLAVLKFLGPEQVVQTPAG